MDGLIKFCVVYGLLFPAVSIAAGIIWNRYGDKMRKWMEQL